MFNVPTASSPPTTPNWRQRKPNTHFFSASNPSTTPAGPPPSSSYSVASTTPAGQPPSSTFGSSRIAAPNIYSTANIFPKNDFPSSPPRGGGLFDRHLVDEDAMDEDVEGAGNVDNWPASTNNGGDEELDIPFGSGLNVQAIAKTLSKPLSTISEPDGIVKDTEDLIGSIWTNIEDGTVGSAQERDPEVSLAVGADHILQLWQKGIYFSHQQQGAIGPPDSAPPFTKAYFVSTLAFAVNFPSESRQSTQWAVKSIPEALMAWLREQHNPLPDDFQDVSQFKPNSTAHERFWDVVLSLALRGELAKVASLLKEADFREALTALGDGADEPGYHGKQLSMVQKVINRAVSVVESSPALQSNDWNTWNTEWSIFRKRVQQALNDLDTLAKGSFQDTSMTDPHELEASHFGLSSAPSNRLSMSQRFQKAESKVPWTIYTNLKYLYDQLLGKSEEIMAASVDWVGAAIGLTVWWDGESDITSRENLRSSLFSASKSQLTRAVDLNPRKAYRNRLKLSLNYLLAENRDAELQVNTMNPTQVGIAAVFEQDLPGLITILRGWSPLIATAIAELTDLATNSGWRGPSLSSPKKLLSNFDQSDLMVLSFGKQPDAGIDVDQLRITYADMLAQKPKIESVEGWKLAIGVLVRLENKVIAQSRIASLLNSLDLTSSHRVWDVLDICNRLGLNEQARQVAESFGDYLSSSTNNYGEALRYYGLARHSGKFKQVIDVLVSTSLIQSASYPASDQLDEVLGSMVKSPQVALRLIRGVRTEDAAPLCEQVSGYAMLRTFYELRDQPSSGYKRDAAAALTPVIISAADSIHGGLFDESVHSAVAVENLLLLLGEALPFLSPVPQNGQGRDQRVAPLFSTPQLFTVMKAIEDLCSLPDYENNSIFAKCEERMRSAIAHAHGADLPFSPRSALRKSISSLTTGSSQFSLLGAAESSSSQELTAMETDGPGSSVVVIQKKKKKKSALNAHRGDEGSQKRGGKADNADTDDEGIEEVEDALSAAQNANVKRAWDWRVGMPLNASGTDLIKILRLGLARNVARAWTRPNASLVF